MEEELICARCSKPINLAGEYSILKTSKQGDVESALCSQCREIFLNDFTKYLLVYPYSLC